MAESTSTARRRLHRLLLAAALPLLAVAAGWLLAPGAGSDYLQLQGQSDALHRGVVLAGPLLAIAFVLVGLLALVFTDFTWPHRLLSGLTMLILCSGLALGAYVVRFDLSLEASGRSGQFVRRRSWDWDATHRWSLPAIREQDGPGIAAVVPGRLVTLVLDRRSLSLQNRRGERVWNRRRPGGWPGWLLAGSSYTLAALPAPNYDDDVLLQMIDMASGRLLFEYHVLGNRVAGLAASGQLAALSTWRPVESCVYLLQLSPPALHWRYCLEHELQLPPRFGGDSLWLVVGGKLQRLAQADGRLLEQRPACQPGSGPALLCRAGKVEGWARESRP